MPRVLVTRAPHQASALAEALRTHGCEPILIPTIEIAPPTSFAPLDAALSQLDRFHWLIFTSANAVDAFVQRASITGIPPLDFEMWGKHHEVLIAAIGPATARALEGHRLRVDLMPPQAVAESFADALLPHALQSDGTPTRFLLVRAETARDHMPDALLAAGAEVDIAPAYRTLIADSSIAELQQLFSDPNRYPDAITFTSSSTVTNLLALLRAADLPLPSEVVRASIGPITSQSLCEAGLPPHIEAPEASVAALAKALASHLHAR